MRELRPVVVLCVVVVRLGRRMIGHSFCLRFCHSVCSSVRNCHCEGVNTRVLYTVPGWYPSRYRVSYS